MRECMSEGLQPDTIAFNSLLSACDKGLNPVQAQAAFDLMASRGLAADAISYACLVSAYASVGDAEAAAAVWRGMPAGREVVVPTTQEGSHASSAGAFETKELFDELLRSCQVACMAARAILFYAWYSMRVILCVRWYSVRVTAHGLCSRTPHARCLRPGHACDALAHSRARMCSRHRAWWIRPRNTCGRWNRVVSSQPPSLMGSWLR